MGGELSLPCPQSATGLDEEAPMPFDHEKLDVYHRALDALELSDRIGTMLPPGRAGVRDQLDRASTSVVANIAEGAGEFS